MTFDWLEWHERNVPWPTLDAAAGLIRLTVTQAVEGGYFWQSEADNWPPGSEVPRRWNYRVAYGYAGTADDAKTAAETMGRRMRKVLRWAR